MKVLRFHPLMTMSLIRLQFRKLLHCDVTIYILHSPAAAFQTLQEAGFPGDVLQEYPIDETLTLREFEGELAEKFHLQIELSGEGQKPFSSKSIRLYQLPIRSHSPEAIPGPDLWAEWPGRIPLEDPKD
ncbi:MAG TPA: hypothetical protein VNE41_08140 [Chitinophagaceae bacterium]|nr:hypothetical protein [Chitinophagaceae bacterium]